MPQAEIIGAMMRSFRIPLSLFTVSVLALGPTGCGSPCEQGYGLAQNGDCRPFQTGDEADVDADVDADADADSDSDPGTPSSGDLEIIGNWLTDLEETHTITNGTWVHEFYNGEDDRDIRNEFTIENYWNNTNFLVAFNLDDNDIDGGLYSRFDWVIDGDEAWFCPTECCATSTDAALNAEAPDATDPSSSGCSEANTEWTKLTRQ